MCPHTCIYNVITLLKMFLLHVHTHRGRKYLSVQQVSFLRGGIILLWASYVLLNVQLAFSISNTYCIYNQKEKKKPKKVVNKSEKKTCRQPVLEALPGKSKHTLWSPEASSTGPITEQR